MIDSGRIRFTLSEKKTLIIFRCVVISLDFFLYSIVLQIWRFAVLLRVYHTYTYQMGALSMLPPCKMASCRLYSVFFSFVVAN